MALGYPGILENVHECPGVTLDPKGGSCKGLQSICMEGGVTYSDLGIVNAFRGS